MKWSRKVQRGVRKSEEEEQGVGCGDEESRGRESSASGVGEGSRRLLHCKTTDLHHQTPAPAEGFYFERVCLYAGL